MTHDEIIDRLDQEVAQWRADVTQARKGVEDEFREIEAALEELCCQGPPSDVHAEELARLESLETDLVDRLGALEAAQSRAADLEILASDLATRLTCREGELSAALGRLREFEEKARQMSEELRQRDALHDDALARAAQLADTVTGLQAELDVQRVNAGRAAERIAQLEAEVTELAARTSDGETEKRLRGLQEETARLSSALAAAEEQASAASGRARQLDEKVAELTAELFARDRSTEESGGTQAQSLQEELNRVSGELDAAQSLLAETRKEIAARPPLGQIEELHHLLAEERERADLLESRLQRHAKAEADTTAADQLANALRDRDEAHQEIVALRAEIDMLRRANASLAVPSSTGDQTDLAEALERMGLDGGRRRMGEILIALGLITQEQLAEALRSQDERPQRRLGAILIEKGYTTQEIVARVLARQIELPFVRLSPDTLEMGATALISPALARRHQCIPVGASPTHVTLAMANPFDLVALDDVQMATGRRAEPVVASPADVAAAIARCYGVA